MSEKVYIFDTTLRDGEQVPGCKLNTKEKLALAVRLEELGVDILEAGFPVSSPGDFDSVHQIAKTLKNTVVCGLTRAVQKDIEVAAQALKPAARFRIHTGIGTSDLHIKYKFNSTREAIIERAVQAVKMARNFTDDVEFYAEDAGRTDNAYLAQVIEAVNGHEDAFLRDRQTGTTELISVATDGTQGNDVSTTSEDAVSADGRYVSFYSYATNLDPDVSDTNDQHDAFLRDRQTGTTTLISRSAQGNTSANAASRVVSGGSATLVVGSMATNLPGAQLDTVLEAFQLFAYDVAAEQFELITDDASGNPLGGEFGPASVSDDGRFVLFTARASSDFGAAPDDHADQVVLKDLQSGQYQLISASSTGTLADTSSYSYPAAISANGASIVFESDVADLEAGSNNTGFRQIYAVSNPFLEE